ncbi:MAG TPA: hypothetical protein VF552_01075 [Allosphingosinicella sp.]|jgi:hypothetical protein
MPFYHFHVRGGGIDFVDEAGADCRDDVQALAQAQWIARETLLDGLEEGARPGRATVEVQDRAGRTLCLVPVAFALPAPTIADLARCTAAARRRV